MNGAATSVVAIAPSTTATTKSSGDTSERVVTPGKGARPTNSHSHARTLASVLHGIAALQEPGGIRSQRKMPPATLTSSTNAHSSHERPVGPRAHDRGSRRFLLAGRIADSALVREIRPTPAA